MAKLSVEEIILRGARHRAQRLNYEELKSLKVCFWDIESSNLDADFGLILCAGIKTLGVPGIRIYRIDESPEYAKKPWDDSWVAKRIRDDLEQHNVIVHHYGDRFDVPFLNTRLIGHRIRMLDSSRMCFVDTWLNVRKRLKLHSNRLNSLIAHLDTKTNKTGLDGHLWVKALAGHKPSLDAVVKHNLHDIKALEEVAVTLARFYNLRYTYVK